MVWRSHQTELCTFASTASLDYNSLVKRSAAGTVTLISEEFPSKRLAWKNFSLGWVQWTSVVSGVKLKTDNTAN